LMDTYPGHESTSHYWFLLQLRSWFPALPSIVFYFPLDWPFHFLSVRLHFFFHLSVGSYFSGSRGIKCSTYIVWRNSFLLRPPRHESGSNQFWHQ
jgi:hypothetical protein